jgi:hypothetical protein
VDRWFSELVFKFLLSLKDHRLRAGFVFLVMSFLTWRIAAGSLGDGRPYLDSSTGRRLQRTDDFITSINETLGSEGTIVLFSILTLVVTALAYRQSKLHEAREEKAITHEQMLDRVEEFMATKEALPSFGKASEKAEPSEPPKKSNLQYWQRHAPERLQKLKEADEHFEGRYKLLKRNYGITVPGDETFSVRLVPQVPIQDNVPLQGWFGGEPRLPADCDWPYIDGVPSEFLMQVNCSELPAALWDGLGPRNGWLAIFIQVNIPTYSFSTPKVKVIHTTQQGDVRSRPEFADSAPATLRKSWINYSARPSLPANLGATAPRWPFVIRQGLSIPNPRDSRPTEKLILPHWNVTDWPFDWTSAAYLIEHLILRCKERSHLDHVLSKTDDYVRVQPLRNVAINALVQMRQSLEDLSRKIAFSADAWNDIVARLDRVIVPMLPISPMEEPTGFVEVAITNPALGWAGRYSGEREALARTMYCRDPHSLPAHVYEQYRERWQHYAEHDLAIMGNLPYGFVDQYDQAEDVTLLELEYSNFRSLSLPSSIIIVKKSDLHASDFRNAQLTFTS